MQPPRLPPRSLPSANSRLPQAGPLERRYWQGSPEPPARRLTPHWPAPPNRPDPCSSAGRLARYPIRH